MLRIADVCRCTNTVWRSCKIKSTPFDFFQSKNQVVGKLYPFKCAGRAQEPNQRAGAYHVLTWLETVFLVPSRKMCLQKDKSLLLIFFSRGKNDVPKIKVCLELWGFRNYNKIKLTFSFDLTLCLKLTIKQFKNQRTTQPTRRLLLNLLCST